MTENSQPWYQKGLSFECTACGKCCTGTPGFVWVNEEEVADMANFLKISPAEFQRKYLRRVGGHFALVEMKKNYDCVFLKEGKCLVYAARPTQCKTFPWWPQNLSSPEAWETVRQQCEGIQDEASLVNFETIEEQKLIQIKRNHKP